MHRQRKYVPRLQVPREQLVDQVVRHREGPNREEEQMAHVDVDAIVIGSGAGGLTAAVALARAGVKVLVCEQHYVPGGWCHTFTREGYRFSPGVHYIGGLGPGGPMRAIYEGLGVSQHLVFCEINPDGYDHVMIGNERFDIPKGSERFAQRLIERFPHERTGIEAYFGTVKRLMSELESVADFRLGRDLLGLPFRISTLLRWGSRSAQALLSHHLSDPLLIAILSAQAGDHGMPPSLASAPVHAAIAHHYFEGAFYPMGGGFAIPRAFVRALKEAGGDVMLSAKVERILLEGKRAIGVRLADGTEIRAKQIISNADPEVTFGQLIGRRKLSGRLRRKLDRTRYSVSALSLFLAVDMDVRAAGFDSGNYWFYRHNNIDDILRQGLTSHVLEHPSPQAMFLTVTTNKDPTKMHSGHHTLEAFTFVGYDAFRKWAQEAEGERSADYEALKAQLMERMIGTADEIIPGLRDHVVFSELGTPLTNEHYLNVTRGSLYGIEKGRWQVGPLAFPLSTEFQGLWMCGASTLGHGVAGATSSGLAVAAKILGCRRQELLDGAGSPIQVYPSEDPGQWPARLRRRIREHSAREPVEEVWAPPM